MRFHSSIATLESQNNVIPRAVWTENILLVRGRLVLNCDAVHVDFCYFPFKFRMFNENI